MWLLLASTAWPCQPPPVFAYLGRLDGEVVPEDGGFPLFGAFHGADVEVFGPDGAPVSGHVETIAPGALGRWIADAPMSPGAHHVVFTDRNWLDGPRVSEVDFEAAGASVPPLDPGFAVTAGEWAQLPPGPCTGSDLERPLTLTFDTPGGTAVAIEDLYLGHPIDAAWRDDGVLEATQRAPLDVPWPACFRVWAVGWDRDVIEDVVCDEGSGASAPGGCSNAPGTAAWWLLLLVTSSARRARPRRASPRASTNS